MPKSPIGLFPSCLPTKTLNAFLMYPIVFTCPERVIPLHLVTFIIFYKIYMGYGPVPGCCECGNEHPVSIKQLDISWPAKRLLTSQEGLCSMELEYNERSCSAFSTTVYKRQSGSEFNLLQIWHNDNQVSSELLFSIECSVLFKLNQVFHYYEKWRWMKQREKEMREKKMFGGLAPRVLLRCNHRARCAE
jgi:hypothetical protein